MKFQPELRIFKKTVPPPFFFRANPYIWGTRSLRSTRTSAKEFSPNPSAPFLLLDSSSLLFFFAFQRAFFGPPACAQVSLSAPGLRSSESASLSTLEPPSLGPACFHYSTDATRCPRGHDIRFNRRTRIVWGSVFIMLPHFFFALFTKAHLSGPNSWPLAPAPFGALMFLAGSAVSP